MKQSYRIVPIAILAFALAGCVPTVTAVNNTSFPVRVIVSSAGSHDMLSPSPGESSSAEVTEGHWMATVIPDQEWIDYAKSVRQYLNDQLANPQHLSGQELLTVIQHLKEIAAQMQAFEKAAATQDGARCLGTINSDNDSTGTVEISTGADGALIAVCK